MSAIEVHGLTKRFGPVLAVDDVSFRLEAGTITGFLGPNGAGKTTTLQMLLSLSRPTAGTARIAGARYEDLDAPARTVGVVLEPRFHPGRRAVDHLRVAASAIGAGTGRIDAVLDHVGLAEASRRRVGGFSLGMRQRLALATALLGEPEVLILDEPANGLDPDGMQWLRRLLRSFGDEGGTVLVSSHVLAEVAQTVDDVLVLAGGRLVTHQPLSELAGGRGRLLLRAPDLDALDRALAAAGISSDPAPDGLVTAAHPDAVGRAIAAAGVVVYEIRPIEPSLEHVFFDLTHEGSHR